ncbi:hypothetical protein [Ancylobacter sp. G4_0304]|uniref:hypothetical protein n=1 Tax=Ancylobacter sp. G4_0304 TaxID=3114289 RepID=UPI0039C64DD2
MARAGQPLDQNATRPGEAAQPAAAAGQQCDAVQYGIPTGPEAIEQQADGNTGSLPPAQLVSPLPSAWSVHGLLELARRSPARTLGIAALLAITGHTAWTLTTSAPSDVPTAWNKGVARLGISPLYPPQEDFHVGDIWVMPVAASAGDVTLIGKAARVGFSGLATIIQQEATKKPRFEVTKPIENSFRDQKASTVVESTDNMGLPLYLAAFPGITLDNTSQTDSLLNLLPIFISSWFRSTETDDIRISSVETYGASYPEAMVALELFCRGKDGWLCKDEFARKVLHFVDKRFTQTDCDGKFIYPLQVMLVNRVFTAREIDRKYGQRADGAIEGALSGNEDTDELTPNIPAPEAGNGAAGVIPAPSKRSREGAAWVRHTGNGMILEKQVFARPLVFGYRGVSFAIDANHSTNAKLKVPPPWFRCVVPFLR